MYIVIRKAKGEFTIEIAQGNISWVAAPLGLKRGGFGRN